MKSMRIVIIGILILSFSVHALAQDEQGESYFDLGVFAYEDQDYDAAVKNLKNALSHNPDNPYFNHYLGKTYMQMGQYDEAKTHFEVAMAIDPNVEELKYDYAYVHYAIKDYEKSAELFEEVIKDEPSNVLARYYGAISLYETKQYPEAVEYFLIASDRSPSIKANGYYYAGICFQKMGNEEQAKERFEYVRDNADSESLREYAVKWLDAMEQQEKSLKPYSLYAQLGYGYDDNVRLEPLDNDELYADEGDYAALGLFSGKYNFINKRKYQIGAGLTWYQTRYAELYEYDLMAAIGSLYGNYRMGPVLLGLDYIPNKYWVNSDDYMIRHQFKPTATWTAGKHLITKLSLNYSINDNLVDDERDGDSTDLFLDGYFLVPAIKGMVLAGLGYEAYNTENVDYSYSQLKAKLGLSLTPLWGITLGLTGGYDSKVFDDFSDDSIYPEKREDSKVRGSVSLSRNIFWDWLGILFEYNYTDNQSTVEDYTYKRNVTTLSLTASF